MPNKSIEELITDLTEAVKENTKQHAEFAAIAAKAAGAGKATGGTSTKADDGAEEKKPTRRSTSSKTSKSKTETKSEEADEQEAEEEEKETKKPAPKRNSRSKKTEPKGEVYGALSLAELKDIVKPFMAADDDEELRDERKKLVGSAFKHLGIKKLPELEDDTERAKLGTYISHWAAGQEKVDFRALDEAVADAVPAEDQNDEDDDDIDVDLDD